MSTERHIFYSAVVQVPSRRRVPPTGAGNIPVVLRLYKQTRFWFDGPDDYETHGPLTVVDTRGVLRPRECTTHFAAEELLLMPIPLEEVPAIIDKLARKLSLVTEVPNHRPITVLIFDITVFLFGSADFDHVIDGLSRATFRYLGHLIRGGEVIEESIASSKANHTPAARSFIHGLKKLGLDSLEETVIRETPTCAVCLEDFAESVEQLITCLPCKHHYHVNCIVRCLEINHLCPLCRYPVPTVEACELLANATAN